MTRRKRSMRRGARAVMLGGAAFGLAACGAEEQADLTYFETLEQCERNAGETFGFTVEDCAATFAEARAEHAIAAPRYDSLALCEEQHGEGVCGTEAALVTEALDGDAVVAPEEGEVREAGGGSIFMPLMLGYMMGNAMSGRGWLGRPLYPSASRAGLYTAGGRPLGTAAPGAALRGDQALLRPATASMRPMGRAEVAARGGFGAARTAAGGFRGFGG